MFTWNLGRRQHSHSLLFSIVVKAARTLGDDVFIVIQRDDVCSKEQSCPGQGLWEQCDHGPAGGVGRGRILLNFPEHGTGKLS